MSKLRCFAAIALLLLMALAAISPAAAQTDLTVHATAQRFEHGLMIWRSDTAYIWVLADNGRVLNYPASYYGPLRDNPITALSPTGIKPIFGFGKVWGNHRTVRQLLGWPVLLELGFNMRIQRSGVNTLLTQMDGSVIVISSNRTWMRHPGSDVTPPPPPPPGPLPRIVTFTANPNPVTPGGALNLTWDAIGTQFVRIEWFDQASNALIGTLHTRPLNGSDLIIVPPTVTSGLRLLASGVDYNRATGTYDVKSGMIIDISVTPIQTSIITQAAYQTYQNGFMIWRADTGTIYVFGLGSVGIYPQSGYQYLPDNPYEPGPGFIKPINGFGRVWASNDYTRKYMGWATSPEQSYQTTITLQGENPISFSLPDGRTVMIENGTWRF